VNRAQKEADEKPRRLFINAHISIELSGVRHGHTREDRKALGAPKAYVARRHSTGACQAQPAWQKSSCSQPHVVRVTPDTAIIIRKGLGEGIHSIFLPDEDQIDMQFNGDGYGRMVPGGGRGVIV
jgi:hypothetical protein